MLPHLDRDRASRAGGRAAHATCPHGRRPVSRRRLHRRSRVRTNRAAHRAGGPGRNPVSVGHGCRPGRRDPAHSMPAPPTRRSWPGSRGFRSRRSRRAWSSLPCSPCFLWCSLSFLPFLILLTSFDQLASDLQARSLCYSTLRARRSEILLGKAPRPRLRLRRPHRGELHRSAPDRGERLRERLLRRCGPGDAPALATLDSLRPRLPRNHELQLRHRAAALPSAPARHR